MSLKTRLRLFTIALILSVVSALTMLYVYSLTAVVFSDMLQRAQASAYQVTRFTLRRLKEFRAEQPPASTEEGKRRWAELLTQDQEYADFLGTAAMGNGVVEVLVADETGRIIADSVPSRLGHKAYKLPEFTEWNKKGPWGKLADIFSQRRDYELAMPIGFAGQTQPVFIVKVLLSPVLLRDMVYPQIQQIMLIFLAALLLSMLLAVAVSNLALRPLANISQAIDRISRGDFEKPPPTPDSGAKEFAAVQSKLTLLGQQYQGAKQDALQLRSNIEQLLERLEEVVFLFDRDDRLVMAGRAAERVLGRNRWELMGRPLTEVFPTASALGAAVRNSIELRQPLKDLPLSLDRDGPGPSRLLVSVETLESFPDHKRIGTLVTLRDAESRKQIRSQLDISARLAAISRLTGGVAHEIKNPLQAITVHLELLKSKLAEETELVGPEIDTIAREIQRLDRVVKTFLDFTRPIDLRMRDLEMVGLTREVVSLVSPSAARQSVEIELDSDPAEVYVHGDRDLMQQAMLNVIVNGVEAMKKGGRLRIDVRRMNGECCVSIADEGIGIPEEIRDKIFNLYYSTKGKGSGIGLAMTFRVVQLHNGTIDFSSEPGTGTTFRLRFPALEREPFSDAQAAADGQQAG